MKDKHAQAMGKKGGKARAMSLTPARRKEIAQKAVKARWDKKLQAELVDMREICDGRD